MDPNAPGMWIVPTYGRASTNVPRFLRAAIATGISTPGALVVDESDYADNSDLYDALELPKGWTVYVVKGGCCADATREAMADLFRIDMQWFGWLGDDVVPETSGWDRLLISQLNGWNFLSCNDTLQAPATAGSTMLWSGDLLRSIGYIYPPGFHHMYPDTIIEEIGRATGCWTVDMNVTVRHLHAGKTGDRDATYAKANSHWAQDDRAFLDWKKNEKHGAIERVLALMSDYGVPMIVPNLRGIEVMLATPCGDGRYENLFVESLRATEQAVRQYGGEFRFAEMLYVSDIALARNRIFGAFLNSTATHLFLVDDDQAWAPQDFIKLLLSGLDFVAAASVRKTTNPTFAVNVSDDFGRTIPIEVDSARGYLKVAGVGTAFMCVSRACVERMAQQYVDLQFDSAEGRTEYGVFNPMIVNRRYLSEDYAWCHRWRQIGGEIWVDPTVDLKHMGTKVFSGAWLDELARKIADEQEEAA